jgi:hypothetical protein
MIRMFSCPPVNFWGIDRAISVNAGAVMPPTDCLSSNFRASFSTRKAASDRDCSSSPSTYTRKNDWTWITRDVLFSRMARTSRRTIRT